VQFQQALIRRDSDGSLSIGLCSPAFELSWNSKVLAVCEAFSADPPSIPVPAVLFVQRLGRTHFMIVRSKAETSTAAGPGRFHVLVVHKKDYAGLQCDLFALADRFAPNWSAVNDLPELEWQGPPLPRRTIVDVQQVLKRDNGPELLGGCQALLDGSRLLFTRPEPDATVVRDLWTLLPFGNRLELTMATFAWNNKLRFDIVVAPLDHCGSFAGYMKEEQAGGYPEGRFELSLQTAAEAEDQDSLDVLWARRSRREVWQLGFLLMAVLGILALAIRFMAPTPRP
jgi:hypothetical protein